MESWEETTCLTFSKGLYRQDVCVALMQTELLPEYARTPKFRIGTATKKEILPRILFLGGGGGL